MDADYRIQKDNSVATRLFVKSGDGKSHLLYDASLPPYFYLIPRSREDALEKLEGKFKAIEELESGVLELIAKNPLEVPKLREEAAGYGEIREYDVPYVQRYFIDKDLSPLETHRWEVDNKGFIKGNAKKTLEKEIPLEKMAMDIEVRNPRVTVDAEKDEVIMISVVGEKTGGKVLTWKKINHPKAKACENELEMIKAFLELSKDVDVMYTYNGDSFDLPYLKNRAKKLKSVFSVGRDDEEPVVKRGIRGTDITKIAGRVHIDAFKGAMFLSVIGALNLPRYTLEDVYAEMTGKTKKDVDSKKIWKFWDDEEPREMEELVEYSLQDSEATKQLGEMMLPLYVEVSKLLGQPLFDVSRMTSSQMIESLLMRMTFEKSILAPNKPGGMEYSRRAVEPIKGAFVKKPESGLHDNLVVLDFRSLYPTIIISHNVDPSMLNCNCCKEPHVSPEGHKFCKKKRGLIPEMLQNVLEKRINAKKMMRKLKEGTEEYNTMKNKQQALKIIANATYGYMNYPRARWYSRECAEATTAWGRHYIGRTIEAAGKAGFRVLYADTDSVFLKRENKGKEEVMEFLKQYNDSLPEEMELELEGFYPKGIFVTKREGGAAKKRYALIREDGNIEIKGLEFVRRDWAVIAKKTQQEVIYAVLRGEVEKAKNIVEERIKDLREGKTPLEELVIYTQIKRPLEKYEAEGPHVKAAKRLKQETGEKINVGSVIRYVVVRGAGNIGDRSYPVELVGNRDYDPEYYINNQLLPAVMKILAELGIRKEDLKMGGEQSSLESWC